MRSARGVGLVQLPPEPLGNVLREVVIVAATGEQCTDFAEELTAIGPRELPGLLHRDPVRALGIIVSLQQLVDDLAIDPLLSQLRFQQAATTWVEAVAVLRPVPGEGGIVDQADSAQPFDGAIDQIGREAPLPETLADLLLAAGTAGEEAEGSIVAALVQVCALQLCDLGIAELRSWAQAALQDDRRGEREGEAAIEVEVDALAVEALGLDRRNSVQHGGYDGAGRNQGPGQHR